MKNSQGTTFIELVVALSTGVMLIAALGFYSQGWMNIYRMEGDVKEMYCDLLRARAEAMERNRNHFLIINADNYQIYEDTNDNGQYDAGADKSAVFTKPKTPTLSSLWTGVVIIDTKGVARTGAGPSGTIRFDASAHNLDHDCILVWATRINMGKWDGDKCVAE